MNASKNSFKLTIRLNKTRTRLLLSVPIGSVRNNEPRRNVEEESNRWTKNEPVSSKLPTRFYEIYIETRKHLIQCILLIEIQEGVIVRYEENVLEGSFELEGILLIPVRLRLAR